jgi:hypothetical protein
MNNLEADFRAAMQSAGYNRFQPDRSETGAAFNPSLGAQRKATTLLLKSVKPTGNGSMNKSESVRLRKSGPATRPSYLKLSPGPRGRVGCLFEDLQAYRRQRRIDTEAK